MSKLTHVAKVMKHHRSISKFEIRNSKLEGYTLIEILITLTIIGFIFGTGYAAFREFSRRQALAATARELMGNIRLAQSQSLSGKKPDDSSCRDPYSLEYYSITFTGVDSYEINAVCTGGSVLVKNVTLSSGVTITPPSVNPIEFKVVGEGTNLASSMAITISAFGTTSIVTVSPGGTVE